MTSDGDRPLFLTQDIIFPENKIPEFDNHHLIESQNRAIKALHACFLFIMPSSIIKIFDHEPWPSSHNGKTRKTFPKFLSYF